MIFYKGNSCHSLCKLLVLNRCTFFWHVFVVAFEARSPLGTNCRFAGMQLTCASNVHQFFSNSCNVRMRAPALLEMRIKWQQPKTNGLTVMKILKGLRANDKTTKTERVNIFLMFPTFFSFRSKYVVQQLFRNYKFVKIACE